MKWTPLFEVDFKNQAEACCRLRATTFVMRTSRPSAQKGGHRSTRLFLVFINRVAKALAADVLAANFDVASASHDDLHRMTTAGPGVGADLTAQ